MTKKALRESLLALIREPVKVWRRGRHRAPKVDRRQGVLPLGEEFRDRWMRRR